MSNPNGNPQNLIPSNKVPKEVHLARSRKGGQARTLAKKEAGKWRALRENIKMGKIKTKNADWLIERVTNPDAMALDMLGYADEIKDSLHPSQRVSWLNAVSQLKKSIHGEKHHNINVNVNVDADEFHNRLMDGF